MNSARPFADAVLAYAQAGWSCIMPVPVEKSPPPVGFTGAEGKDTDAMQLALWAGSHADSSIALRMPDGVIGIDVDNYEKHSVQKHGGRSFAAAVDRWGPLPATWMSTARNREQGGIAFYRVPVGRYATKLAGGDVEIIQRHHRYAVVWPSMHLDAGDIYRWYDPAGNVSDQPPKPIELPELPEAWIAGLREGATDQGPAAADIASGEYLLSQLKLDAREACAEITNALSAAHRELDKADAGSRHDTMTARVHNLVQLAAAGHPGVGQALAELSWIWDAATAGEARDDEFERMLVTSARKAVTVVGPVQVDRDPCFEAHLTPYLAPTPDPAPGQEPAEPIAPPTFWSIRQVIGVHLFDPRGMLDQTMAEAVLERVYPATRYAVDAKGWLRRAPERWEHLGDLSEWAVAEVASLMPYGNPDAEKGSEAFDQAARHKKFMSAAPSTAIAKKMRAVVSGGTHPASVRITDLDAEPWLIWAGGLAWDLRASTAAPTLAHIDPATPHLRAAGTTPELRPTPLWDAFTAAVFPDAELRAWALRVVSIAFTGYSDKALPILVGEANRGKTQLIALLMTVLGNYAHSADPRLLSSTDNAHASIFYALKGRRLSFIDEGPRAGKAGMERLKQITGGGDLTGNQMGQNPITFTPTHTLVLTSNDEPNLTDPAVRGRVRLIPCVGDPDEVRAARAAIGHTRATAWQAEAPGVLAAMMAQAGQWLADERSALTVNAPEAYRFLSEQLAHEQDPLAAWLAEAVIADEAGTRSSVLYKGFRTWCRDQGTLDSQIPTVTKWGRELNARGFPALRRMEGNYRGLKVRPDGDWFGVAPAWRVEQNHGQLLEGSDHNPPEPSTPANTDVLEPENRSNGGLEGSSTGLTHMRAHTRARTHAHEQRPGATLHPSNPPEAHSAAVTRLLLAGRNFALQETNTTETAALPSAPSPVELPAKPRRTKVDPAVRAAEKLAAKDAARQAKIAEATGALVTLPAVVTRDGAVRSIELGNVPALLEAFSATTELTVDVEHTGYPIGHRDYALRTIQLGNDQVAVVYDATDAGHRAQAAVLLEAAPILHAHSAGADLVPLAMAGVITDLDEAWRRMQDTVIPGKLADPSSTGSDPDLKSLSKVVLGAAATSPAAEAARTALFKAGGWLTNTKVTTPLDRSGWAHVDHRSATMIRYDASDVLDAAALAKALPVVPPAILERERVAQRLTARVAHEGLRIDGEHVNEMLTRVRPQLADAGARLQAAGVVDAGSDKQVAEVAVHLGAVLPKTATGRDSVAAGALDRYRRIEGALGDFVRARLDYQAAETALGLFLEPYRVLVEHGDGRARPTVYTLGADTGRMSCVRPNLQQVTREGGYRACITADPGMLLASADFASVELRVAAALSGDRNLKQMLANGADLHWIAAREVYGPDATKSDRYSVKRGVFGWLYGGQVPTLARQMGVSESIAASLVDVLAGIAPELVAWTEHVKQTVKAGYKQFPSYSGRIIHLPRAPHAAPNYCIQGTARELLVDTLMRWQESRWANAVLLPVHDEVLIVVPENEAAEATAALVAAMETELYGVAIKAEASEPSFAWKDAA